MAEEKVDGWRCLYFPGVDRKPGLWTRGGLAFRGADHILARLVEIEAALGGPHMIDGEFQVGGALTSTKAHQESGWRSGDAGTFFAFDCVPLADWERGRCDTPLYERKAALRDAIAATAPDAGAWEWREGSNGRDHGIDPVRYLEDVWLFDDADVRVEAERVWAANGEGLMLKDPSAPYVRARSDSWLKVKRPGVG
jgi:ATP-dependent DNA ligase